MVNISNIGPSEFRKYISGKHVFLFGGGRALSSCLDIYFENKKVDMVIDNNSGAWGKIISYSHFSVSVGGINGLINLVNLFGKKNSIIFITSTFYAAEMVEQLDLIPELDGVDCFLQILIRDVNEFSGTVRFTQGKQIIPKKIHYVWLGGNTLPKEFQDNIDSWKRWNPDYEIKCWTEQTYDISRSRYVSEAVAAGAWGFASNYIRLDVVHREGGVYLDTDVKALRNFDCLLNDVAFFNMGTADRVNNGCGFGSISGHSLLSRMIEGYDRTSFYDQNGRPVKQPGHHFLHPSLKEYGFLLENYYQKRNGVVLYPTEVMSPSSFWKQYDNYTNNTVSVHQESGTWKNAKERSGLERIKAIVNRCHFE